MFLFYFLPADKLGSVKTSEYTDKSLPLSFPKCKNKKKRKKTKNETTKFALFIVALLVIKNVCAFLCEDPSRISFGKMSKVCFLHFTSPSVFERQFKPSLMQEYLTV